MKTKVLICIREGREYNKTKHECYTIEFFIDFDDNIRKNKIIKEHILYAFNTFDNIGKITIEEEKLID
jgi:hypothetical protein